MSAEELTLTARAQRIRRHIIRMTAAAGSGHPGGSLSCVEILVNLYFRIMRIDPARPDWPDRDRFVLSKGHAAPALYATLAERGFFPTTQLTTLRKWGSMLQGHPDAKRTPGVEASTGSLGQGLSMAVGMALAGRVDKKDFRVFALLGDGESEEGQIWEAAMAGAHYRLSNLVVYLDFNRLQVDGRIEDVMSPTPLADRWRAFGWAVHEVDGHDLTALAQVTERALAEAQGPQLILAHTKKGKGVSFMEDAIDWHGVAPNDEQARQALRELGGEDE